MSVVIVEAKRKLNNAEIFLKLPYSEQIRNKKFYEKNIENLKNGKVRFRLNIEVGKDKKTGWMQ